MKRILILCGSNSCRSQMAEGYLRFYAQQWAHIESAGVRKSDVHPLTIRVMAEDSIDISHHISQAYRQFNGQTFDYLITLCDEAKEQLPATIQFRQHLHFDVPDPAAVIGSPEQQLTAFRSVREIIKKRMLRLIGGRLIEETAAAAN